MASATSPNFHSRFHHPYFTAQEITVLSDKQRGKLSVTQEEKARQQSCAFVEAVGARIGFPRKTIATAQSLYHRFHLFFSRKDFSYVDVSLAALYVSSKMHDTLKKPREILMISYAVRFPELAAKSKTVGGDVDVDPTTVENDRQRLLAVERLILETICFNFTSRMAFPYVIKLGRKLRASKTLTKLAWRVAVDAHRTLVPLEYPPHVIALASVYVAALLASFEQPLPGQRTAASMVAGSQGDSRSAHEIASLLSQGGVWEDEFHACAEDIDEIGHVIVDLLIYAAQNPQSTASPSTPTSPSPHISSGSLRPQNFQAAPPPYRPDQLMRLKIAMREVEEQQRKGSLRRPRQQYRLEWARTVRDAFKDDRIASSPAFGSNEGTIRFLFAPEEVAGAV